ncbi:MAG: NYN domain-containing protein [Actinomycetota bacterium]
MFTRVLGYPPAWPANPASEKGVDVALAVDLIYHAIRQDYDVAIVASTDTDLVPVLTAVCHQRRSWGRPDLEVVTLAGVRKRLRVDGERVREIVIDADEFESAADHTNYAAAKPT